MKDDKPKRLRFSLSTRILAVFLALSMVSLAVIGYFAFRTIRGIGDYALQSNISLGDSAVQDSTLALRRLGEEMIRQKALDVAGQVEIYLRQHPDIGPAELAKDEDLRKIAVQPIGQTGYTAIVDADRFTILVHQFRENEGKDLHELNVTLPSFWQVIQASAGGRASSGYYDWIEPDGFVNQKYAYIAPINTAASGAGGSLTLWSTTYIYEFSAPAEETQKMIAESTADTGRNINQRINSLQTTFIGIFIAVILAVSALAFWLARTITRPVLVLNHGARVIGSGNLDHTVDIRTGDEIEDLSHSFNKMAADLKTQMEVVRLTTAEKERVQKELEIAKGIQQSFLPEFPPEIDGFDLAALNTPALEVGGDFFDFIPVSLNKWGLVIADVSGKGIPAALFMALSRTMIRANAADRPTAAEAISRANNMISEEDRANMFVTLFYGVLDPVRKTLTYINAGHNPPLILGKNAGDVIMLAAKGVALGLMPNIEFEEKEVALHPGDVVILYTDGITEAINRKNEMFGHERIARLVEDHRHLTSREIIKLIEKEVTVYSDGQPQFDDLTLLVVKVL